MTVRRIPVSILLAAIAVAALGYAVRRPVLTQIGAFLVVEDGTRPADAIVVLSGSLPERHEQNRTIGEQLGVPGAALAVVETPASSTLAEARVAIAFLRSREIRSILLVTSKVHTRRASMIFRRLADGDITISYAVFCLKK